MSAEPNFDKLQELNDELEELAEKGELTKAEFERLLGEASKAVGPHEEFLEGLLMSGAKHGFV